MHFRGNNSKKTIYNSNGLVIKKRTDYGENEVIIPKRDFHSHVATAAIGDRFIPRRCCEAPRENHNKFHDQNKNAITDILNCNIPHNYWLRSHISEALDKAFDIKECRVLNFTVNNIQFSDRNDSFHSARLLKRNSKPGTARDDWSCNPRTKPYACFEAVHDSVGFNNWYDRNMMDWSVNGQVVAGFNNNIVIWKHIFDIALEYSVKHVSCLAYCPQGKYLAMGRMKPRTAAIDLWDVLKYNDHVEVVNRASLNAFIIIHCFEWSVCQKFLLCGTSIGIIYVFAVPTLKRIRTMDAGHHYPITTMRFSPTMRFLASADSAGNIVIHDWFTFDVYLEVQCKQCNLGVSLAWHPWNGVELAIAEQMPASIVLLHVPSKQISAFYLRKDKLVCICSLAFNKMTAELLLSISRKNAQGEMELKVLVLASLDRLVDELTIGDGATFLMWDREGTRCVTAGTDDSLSIWKISANKKRDNRRRTSCQDGVLCTLFKRKVKCNCEYGAQFRLWSCIK